MAPAARTPGSASSRSAISCSRATRLAASVLRFGKYQRNREGTILVEADIDRVHAQEAGAEQRGTNGQKGGQPDLRDDQHTPAGERRRDGASGAQCGRERRPSGLSRRCEPRYDARGGRDERHEAERGSIQLHTRELWNERRRPRAQRIHEHGGDDNPARGAEGCQTETFHQQLSDDASLRGAERPPHRELLPAAAPPREEQTCHVRACQQTQCDDGSEEHPCQARQLRADDPRLQRRQTDRPACVTGRVLARELLHHARELSFGRGHGGARGEPGDGFDLARRTRPFRVGGERREDLDAGQEIDARGENAHNRDGTAGDAERPADDARIGAEPALPESPRHDGHVRIAGAIFVGGERSTLAGVAAEQREKRGRDRRTGHLLRPVGGLDRQRGSPPARERHRCRTPLDVDDVWLRQRPDAFRRIDGVDPDQPVSCGVGEWPADERVDHREDGRHRPNAQGQNDDRRERELRARPDQPEREPHVVPHGLDQRQAPAFASGLDDLRQSAECEPSLGARPLRRQPTPDPIVDSQFEVLEDLCTELVVQPAS